MTWIVTESTRRTAVGAVAAAVAVVGLVGCADLPSGIVEEARTDYPNVNLPPERPSYLRSDNEVRSLEEELNELRDSHVQEAEEALEKRS